MELNTQPVHAIERVSDGIRAYFGKIYNYMAGGLAVSSAVAYLATKEPLINLFYSVDQNIISYSALGWVAIISPLVLVFMISSALNHLNTAKASLLFWLFSALMGVSLSNIFLLYTSAAISQAFLVTSGAFLALSLYGYTTNKSLSGLGSFLFMGLVGIILAMLVNLFFKSSFVNFALSIISVLIFAGLTAYDTQKLKDTYNSTNDQNVHDAAAISGALALYLDFINLFRLVLYFMNDRK